MTCSCLTSGSRDAQARGDPERHVLSGAVRCDFYLFVCNFIFKNALSSSPSLDLPALSLIAPALADLQAAGKRPEWSEVGAEHLVPYVLRDTQGAIPSYNSV